MLDVLTTKEPFVRFGVFLAVLATMWLWEWRAARRALSQPRGVRWRANLGILFVDTLVLRLLFPASAVGVALFVEQSGWGLLPRLDLADLWVVSISVIALDLAIYGQHVLFHAVPALWRLHRIHHSDQDVDATTGLRFHPVEILLSIVIKLAVVAALGTPAVAVVLFEVLLNATSLFNHSNIRLPAWADRLLRLFIVTPDMHRVHHSVQIEETNSNYGFNLTWWDRLFGTYRARSRDPQETMPLGVPELVQTEPRGLWNLIGLPFRSTKGAAASTDEDET